MFKDNLRLISLSDGTGMGDELIIFNTNAPVEKLKELEKKSCAVYINGGCSEDVPIWADVLTSMGYVFDFVDSHTHVTAYGTSSSWKEYEYPDVCENYIIENQPEER